MAARVEIGVHHAVTLIVGVGHLVPQTPIRTTISVVPAPIVAAKPVAARVAVSSRPFCCSSRAGYP